MRPHEVISGLMADNSRLAKEKILKEAWEAGCIDFFKGAQLCYDALITFGVQQVAQIEGEDDSTSTFSWLKFEQLARKLSTRQLTGHAARDEIHASAEQADVNDWNLFYRRILLKDLKAGITETTINKVLNKIGGDALQFIIPEFECQLSKDGVDHPERLVGEKMVDIKLDGVRLLTIIDKKNKLVRQFTRNGKENNNFVRITDKLQKIIDHIPGNIVLDGEMVSRSFQTLMKQVNRKEDIDTSDARLALFDIIPLDEFLAGECQTPQKKRHEILSSMAGLFQETCGESVFVIPKMTVDLSTEEGKKAFKEFNQETLKAGYEGIMIKDPNGSYECKRSFNWLKFKPFISLDLEVVGYAEGTGKNEGRLGALICEGEYDGKHIQVSAGGGYTDQQRIDIWTDKDSVIGSIIEVEADCVSQNSDGTYSLRFPRFVRFRELEKGQGKI